MPGPVQPRGNHQWMLQDFEFGQLLGEGGFGKVFLTRERRSKCCVVALKAMVEMPQKQ